MPQDSAIQRIAAASRRLLDREGSEAVTMRRVAKAVGITPMAIYRHYRNRVALLNALADEGFAELAARLERARSSTSIEVRLSTMGEIYLNHALENPHLFKLMFLRPRAGARRFPVDFKAGQSPTANFLAEVIREGMESGVFRRDNVWEVTFALGALSHGLIMLYLGGRTGGSAAHFRNLYRKSFRRYIHGIRR